MLSSDGTRNFVVSPQLKKIQLGTRRMSGWAAVLWPSALASDGACSLGPLSKVKKLMVGGHFRFCLDLGNVCVLNKVAPYLLSVQRKDGHCAIVDGPLFLRACDKKRKEEENTELTTHIGLGLRGYSRWPL